MFTSRKKKGITLQRVGWKSYGDLDLEGGGVEAERIVPFEWCSENGARDGEERGRERGEEIETVKNTKKLFSRDPSIQSRL